MKKIFKKIIPTTLLLLMTFTSVQAADTITFNRPKTDEARSSVTVSGSISSNEEGRELTVIIVPDNVTLSEAESDPSKVLDMGTLKTGENGTFSHIHIYNASRISTGYYDVYISGQNITGDNTSFYYADASAESAYINAVKAATSVSAMQTAFYDAGKIDILYIDTPGFDAADDNPASIALVLLNSKATLPNTINEMSVAVRVAGNITLLNNGLNQYTFDASKNIIEDALNKNANTATACSKYDSISDTGKSNVISSITSKGFTSIAEFEKAFNTVCLLEGIYSYGQSGYGHIDSFLINLASYVSLDLTTYNSSSTNKDYVCSNLLQQGKVSTISDLQSRLNTLSLESSNSNYGGFGSSGSGSSGGSGGYSISGGTNASTNVSNEVFVDLVNVPWAKDDILFLYNKGIVNGVGNKQFMPMNGVKREEFVKMLVEAFDISVDSAAYGNLNFADVDLTAWYAPYIKAAYSMDIVRGISEIEFGIGQIISREDCAVLMNRVAEKKGIVLSSDTALEFADMSSVSEYAVDSVNTLSSNGIINGIGDGTFAPKKSCTRAEVSVMLRRLMSK